jgi:outer membrane protein assembly factor BamC
MIKVRMNKRYAGLTVGLSLLALSGCSQINQLTGAEESVDYKSTVAGEPLSIPPDLAQANRDTHFKAPEGAATFSEYAQGQQARQKANASGVLPATQGIEVMRDGDIRWLVVDQAPDSVYPKVVEFWGDQGFTIHDKDPQAGLIQTDWAENRAKIPEGWIHKALGSLIDQVFDSGERERFRTRVERVNGKSEIYISHQQMVETPTVQDGGFKWVYAKEDPGLNAAMLARLMVYLGTNVQQAQNQVAQAEKSPNEVKVAQAPDNKSVLTLNEPFDRAWRRVGIGIDSAGFTVDDRDRTAGDYFVRYLDTDTGEKIEQSSFFGRLFGTKNKAEPTQYRIHVGQQGDGSTVSILDKNGQPDTSETAQRILTVLSNHMTAAQ